MTTPTHRYLSLGAGVQSTTLLLLAAQARIPGFDAAIFAGRHGEGGADLRTAVAGLGQPDIDRWGVYAAAIARWELLLGRPVRESTQPGRHGKPVLAPPFVEWLMGLSSGHVTDPTLALPRTGALRVLGNGLVPQQAAAALRLLLCPYRWAVLA